MTASRRSARGRRRGQRARDVHRPAAYGTPRPAEEMAAIAVYLASDEASYTTGRPSSPTVASPSRATSRGSIMLRIRRQPQFPVHGAAAARALSRRRPRLASRLWRCSDPYEASRSEIAARLKANGLTLALLNISAGNAAAGERGLAALPGREDDFEATLKRALTMPRLRPARRLHLLRWLRAPRRATRHLCSN